MPDSSLMSDSTRQTSSHQSHEQAALGIHVRIAILTLSDTRNTANDESGRAIREILTNAGHVVAAYTLIRDEPDVLRSQLNAWLASDVIEAIITTGGTGISRRDTTIAVIDSLLDSSLPGFGELFRSLSFQEIGPAAMLSRATAGIANGKFVAALPGSKNAVTLAMRELILPQIQHIVSELRK